MSSTGKDTINKLIDAIKKNKTTAIGALVAGVIGGYFVYQSRTKNNLKIWDESSKNKVILHSLKPDKWKFSTPHASPFVSKLICYFSLNNIPYIIDGKTPMHPKTNKS